MSGFPLLFRASPEMTFSEQLQNFFIVDKDGVSVGEIISLQTAVNFSLHTAQLLVIGSVTLPIIGALAGTFFSVLMGSFLGYMCLAKAQKNIEQVEKLLGSIQENQNRSITVLYPLNNEVKTKAQGRLDYQVYFSLQLIRVRFHIPTAAMQQGNGLPPIHIPAAAVQQGNGPPPGYFFHSMACGHSSFPSG